MANGFLAGQGGGGKLEIEGQEIKTLLFKDNINQYATIGVKNEFNFDALLNFNSYYGGKVEGVSFSKNANYLAVGQRISTGLNIYKRNGDSFNRLTSVTDIGGFCNNVKFGHTGTYLATYADQSPYLYIYKRNGDSFNRLNTSGATLNRYTDSMSFSSDDTYLAVTQRDYPHIYMFKRSGDNFQRIAFPISGVSECRYLLFSPDDSILIAGFISAPFVRVYRRNIDDFVEDESLRGFAGSSITSMAFSHDGKYFVFKKSESPYFAVSKWTGATFEILPLGGEIPYANTDYISFVGETSTFAIVGATNYAIHSIRSDVVYNIAFGNFDGYRGIIDLSSDGKYLVKGGPSGHPIITMHKNNGGQHVYNASNQLKGIDEFGYSLEQGLNGDTKNICILGK